MTARSRLRRQGLLWRNTPEKHLKKTKPKQVTVQRESIRQKCLIVWLHILEAFPTPHLMEMHLHWDQAPSVLPMAQHWLPWFSFSSCWSGQHHSCAGSSTASQVALSSFPQGLHGNCFLCTCPRAWPTSPTLWGCPSGPAHHLHWNFNPMEMGSQQPYPGRSEKPKTPVVTPVPRCRNSDSAWSMWSFLHPQGEQ